MLTALGQDPTDVRTDQAGGTGDHDGVHAASFSCVRAQPIVDGTPAQASMTWSTVARFANSARVFPTTASAYSSGTPAIASVGSTIRYPRSAALMHVPSNASL